MHGLWARAEVHTGTAERPGRAGHDKGGQGRAGQGEGSEWQRARQGMLCFIFRQKARSQEPRALAARCSLFDVRCSHQPDELLALPWK